MTIFFAEKSGYRPCTYCSGLAGDYRVQIKSLKTQFPDFEFSFTDGAVYIRTPNGFWKVWESRRTGLYLLFHQNTLCREQCNGCKSESDFHRQGDVQETNSLHGLVNYICAHDKAKKIIAEDYRKLPRNTVKQKQYYNKARKKKRRQAIRNVYDLFAEIERQKQ